jgi:circadian clock protein KaiC
MMPAAPPLLLPSGVPGLDEILGGGIPETSLTVVGGPAGSGKTTLALQLAFANATAEQPAIYFCGQAESAHRLQQNHDQLKFFDTRRINRDIHLVDLGPHFSERDTSRVLDSLARDIAALEPCVVVVDLPRTLTPPTLWSELLAFLVCRVATCVLLAEGSHLDRELEATLSAADNVVWLDNSQTTRTIEVPKVRGQAQLPGKHALQLDWDGMRSFPRWPTPWRRRVYPFSCERQSTGVAGIDRLMGGGAPVGGSILVEGSSGTGKTILGTQFIADAGHQGLPALVLLVEERADRFIGRAEMMDLQLERLVNGGLVEVHSLRGRDICADALLHVMQRSVLKLGAQCVLIDSAGGLELLVEDVRDFVWRAVDSLCSAGVTVWLNHSGDAQLRPLVDDVLRLSQDADRRMVEVVKSSGLLKGSRVASFEIGASGIDVLSQDKVRPSNGHLVNYRLAAG